MDSFTVPTPGDTRRLDAVEIFPRHAGAMRAIVDGAFRMAYAAGFRAARVVWSLTHPEHRGALVAVRVGNAMLMLRQSYRPEWSMPGGGISPGEDPEAAARRELVEELDLPVPDGALRCVHTETGMWDGRRDTVSFFELDLGALPRLRLDNREVISAALLPIEELAPTDVTPAVGAYLAWLRRAT